MKCPKELELLAVSRRAFGQIEKKRDNPKVSRTASNYVHSLIHTYCLGCWGGHSASDNLNTAVPNNLLALNFFVTISIAFIHSATQGSSQ